MILYYFDTLYQREAHLVTISTVMFKACGIEFYNMGRKEYIEYQYIRRLESSNCIRVTYRSLNYNSWIPVLAEKVITFEEDGIVFETSGSSRAGSIEYPKIFSAEEVEE